MKLQVHKDNTWNKPGRCRQWLCRCKRKVPRKNLLQMIYPHVLAGKVNANRGITNNIVSNMNLCLLTLLASPSDYSYLQSSACFCYSVTEGVNTAFSKKWAWLVCFFLHHLHVVPRREPLQSVWFFLELSKSCICFQCNRIWRRPAPPPPPSYTPTVAH